jgi:hypothetical protein
MNTRSRSTSDPHRSFWIVDVDLDGQGAQFHSSDETGDALFDWHFGRALLEGRRKPTSPLVFRQVRKSRWYDMLWSGQAQIMVVSSRLVDLLKAEHATGWSTYPLTLLDKRGKRVPGYCGLAVTGASGPIEWKRSERVLKPPAVPRGKGRWVRRGAWFDEESWDGSDFFFPGETMHLMVSDRIVRAMKRAKLKGIEFEHQSVFEMDEWLVKDKERERRRAKRSPRSG